MADMADMGVDLYKCDLSDLPGFDRKDMTKSDKYGNVVRVGNMVKFANVPRMCDRYGMTEKWEVSYMSDWFRIVDLAPNGTHLTLIGWNGLKWSVLPDEVTIYGLSSR